MSDELLKERGQSICLWIHPEMKEDVEVLSNGIKKEKDPLEMCSNERMECNDQKPTMLELEEAALVYRRSEATEPSNDQKPIALDLEFKKDVLAYIKTEPSETYDDKYFISEFKNFENLNQVRSSPKIHWSNDGIQFYPPIQVIKTEVDATRCLSREFQIDYKEHLNAMENVSIVGCNTNSELTCLALSLYKDDQNAIQNEKIRLRKKRRKLQETPEEAEHRRMLDRIRQQQRRESQTPEERDYERMIDRIRKQQRRKNETMEERERRRLIDRIRQQQRREKLTMEEREHQRLYDKLRKEKRRQEAKPSFDKEIFILSAESNLN